MIKAGEAAKIGDKIKTAIALAAMTVSAGVTNAAKTSAAAVKVEETMADPADGAVVAKVNPAVMAVAQGAIMAGALGRTSGEALAVTTIRARATTAVAALKAASAAMTTRAATMVPIKDTGRITKTGPVIMGHVAEASVGSGTARAMRSLPGSVMMMLSVAAVWMSSVAVNTVDVAQRAILAPTSAFARM
jgi:hypothetical protein